MNETPETRPCPAQSDEDFMVASVSTDPKLVREGWVRRHFAERARVQESIDLYTSMGFEVKVQELTPADFGPQCAHCASVMCHACVLIYTRKTEP
ncbi:MAG: hypothetical protein ACYTA3_08470 [Planctomycetota bacterium]